MKTLTTEQYSVNCDLYRQRFKTEIALDSEGNFDMTRHGADVAQSVTYTKLDGLLDDALTEIAKLQNELTDANRLLAAVEND